jgi:hypothetical protein
VRTVLALATVAALALGVVSETFSQGTVTVAIDVDVAGNDARTVATIDNCVRIDSGSELEIDVVLPDPGIASDVGIQAYQFQLLYDPDVVTVTAQDQEFLLSEAGGSLLLPLSDFLPDSDGTFMSASADRSEAFQIEPEGAFEAGPGVITRITLSAVAKGSTDLTLADLILVDVGKNSIPVGELVPARVSIDTPCTEPPPPTVLPAVGSPEPFETPGTGAETPGAADETPGTEDTPRAPGTPGAGPEDLQTPGASTPGPNTPVLADTPTSDGGANATGGTDDDGGLSTGAWVGIGLGIAAAVLAAVGGGWYALRRRKAGSQ